MKHAILAILTSIVFSFGLVPHLYGQIYADVETTLGTFTMELDPINAPLAVGNFIGLATGSKTWIDSTTGAAKSGVPYYEGIIFHRVIDGFMNQVGSQKGDGTDGPGYQFRDEFGNSDFTDSYRVAMANSGPHSNGSQFFITVGSPTHLNNVHTVFGTVPEDDGPGGIVDGSRAVIDAINTASTVNDKPVTDIVIESINIRRVGAAALAFDAASQPLPIVTATEVAINFPGQSSDPSLDFTQPPGSTFTLGMSPDLENWSITTRYLDATAESPLSTFAAGELQGEKARHFYFPSLVTWPSDAVFADSLANQTLTLATDNLGPAPFTFSFDATGITGNWTWPDPETPLLGNIQNDPTYSSFTPNGYGGRLIMRLTGINYYVWVLQLVLDADSPSSLSGRFTGTIYSAQDSLPVSGTFNLTR